MALLALTHMTHGLLHRVVAMIPVLCMVLHSMGSTPGAYLCVGCDGHGDAIAVVRMACEASSGSCCNNAPVLHHEDEEEDSDCGCIDLALSTSEGRIHQSGLKLSLTPPGAPVLSLDTSETALAEALRPAPELQRGPLLVRQLHPRARRTILLI